MEGKKTIEVAYQAKKGNVTSEYSLGGGVFLDDMIPALGERYKQVMPDITPRRARSFIFPVFDLNGVDVKLRCEEWGDGEGYRVVKAELTGREGDVEEVRDTLDRLTGGDRLSIVIKPEILRGRIEVVN